MMGYIYHLNGMENICHIPDYVQALIEKWWVEPEFIAS